MLSAPCNHYFSMRYQNPLGGCPFNFTSTYLLPKRWTLSILDTPLPFLLCNSSDVMLSWWPILDNMRIDSTNIILICYNQSISWVYKEIMYLNLNLWFALAFRHASCICFPKYLKFQNNILLLWQQHQLSFFMVMFKHSQHLGKDCCVVLNRKIWHNMFISRFRVYKIHPIFQSYLCMWCFLHSKKPNFLWT